MAITNLSQYYSSLGQPLPSLSTRAQLYQQLGLGTAATYSGSTDQNNALLSKLQTSWVSPLPTSTPAPSTNSSSTIYPPLSSSLVPANSSISSISPGSTSLTTPATLNVPSYSNLTQTAKPDISTLYGQAQNMVASGKTIQEALSMLQSAYNQGNFSGTIDIAKAIPEGFSYQLNGRTYKVQNGQQVATTAGNEYTKVNLGNGQISTSNSPTSVLNANTATPATNSPTPTNNETGGGISFPSTGDQGLDQILNSIKGLADNLISSGYTIPKNLQITPDLISTFLGYAHQAIDPYTKQLLDSRITDVNASLDTMAKTFGNQVAARQQQFGTELATEQNTSGATGNAFSGLRNLNESNLAATANRDLSSLGINTAYNMGSAARSAASDVGSANAGGIVLPSIAGGTVSLAGGSRGTTGTGSPLSLNYNPSLYTVGTIPSAQKGAVNQQQQNYISQYGTLAGLNSNTNRSVKDLLGMMSGLPAGYSVPNNLS